MDKNKQIEEMAEAIFQNCNCGIFYSEAEKIADFVINKQGYRKTSEVAEEIFTEIEEDLNNLIRYYKEKRKYVTEVEYSEFEQRYCDIKIRTFEERLLKMTELKKKYTEEVK